MIVEKIKRTAWPSQRVGFLDRELQVGAWNVLIDRLAEMAIADRLVQDHVANGLQQLRMRFRRLNNLTVVVVQGLLGLFVPRRDAHIKDVNALIGALDQRLLQKGQQHGIAALRTHAAEGLQGICAAEASQELLAVGMKSR